MKNGKKKLIRPKTDYRVGEEVFMFYNPKISGKKGYHHKYVIKSINKMGVAQLSSIKIDKHIYSAHIMDLSRTKIGSFLKRKIERLRY
jgi:hypothetical protein